MKTLSIAAFAIATSGMAVSASAQDVPSDHFNGPYVGGSVSLDQIEGGNDRLDFDTNGDGYGDTVSTVAGADAFGPGFCNGNARSALAAGGCSDDKNDIGYAGRIGYDRRIGGGSFVVGALIEGAGSDSKDYTTGFSTTPASYTVGRSLDLSVAGRLRAGFSPGDGRGLFYATGGVAYGKIDHDFATTNTANTFTQLNDNDWHFGWQAGGGAELMLTRNISIGAEYLYSRYNDGDYSVAVTQGSAPASNPFVQASNQTNLRPSDTQLGIHSFRTTLGFHF